MNQELIADLRLYIQAIAADTGLKNTIGGTADGIWVAGATLLLVESVQDLSVAVERIEGLLSDR